ncbi:MAG: hypothetical protein ACI4OT_04785 [Bacilli bacterium]
MENVPTINKDYIDYADRKYEGLKEISFKRTDSISILGRFVTSSKKSEDTFSNSTEGVMILQNETNKNIGYRIDEEIGNYGSFDNFKLCHMTSEPKFIHELIKRQPNIKRTDFPTGIVTIDHYCVGEEISFYEDYISLSEYISPRKDSLVFPEKVFLNLVLNLKELNDNDIYYFDIHNNNFLIKDEKVKIIDFDSMYTRLEFSQHALENQSYNFSLLLKKNLKTLGINETIELSNEKPIDDAIEKILILGQKYR